MKALKEYIQKTGEIGRKHSVLEWETICLNISSILNGLPICHNQDDRSSFDDLGLITPNMYLIGRNNSRAPDGFVMVEPSPSKALKNLQEMENALLDLLGDFVHKFIPGKRFTEVEQPEIDDIVLFVMKEAERKRNVKYKFGRVTEINVDGIFSCEL